jgi:hypothetical protein
VALALESFVDAELTKQRCRYRIGLVALVRWGFEDLPFDPSRSMIVRMIDLERSGIVA